MLPYVLIVLVFLADRLSKQWAAAYLREFGPTQINAFISIEETYNRGIAFGMFQGAGQFVGWITIIVIFGMFIYLTRLPKEEKFVRIGLALLIGGALGNMVDRIRVGQVLDFLETPLWPSVFNVADIAINVGMVFVLIGTIWYVVQARR